MISIVGNHDGSHSSHPKTTVPLMYNQREIVSYRSASNLTISFKKFVLSLSLLIRGRYCTVAAFLFYIAQLHCHSGLLLADVLLFIRPRSPNSRRFHVLQAHSPVNPFFNLSDLLIVLRIQSFMLFMVIDTGCKYLALQWLPPWLNADKAL